MAKKVYACLLGEWVCLNDDPNCVFVDHGQSPYLWWEEGASAYVPLKRNPELENSCYGLDYVKIFYLGKTYRINPMFIQIVEE
mgnify:CR=1 FL=1